MMTRTLAVLFWLLAASVCQAHTATHNELQQVARTQSTLAGVDPLLVESVIAVESSWRPAVRNGTSYGLMQVNKTYHAPRMKLQQLLEPKTNLSLGIQVLKKCHARFKTTVLALSCYNGSMWDKKRVYAGKVLKVYSQLVRKADEEARQLAAKAASDAKRYAAVDIQYHSPTLQALAFLLPVFAILADRVLRPMPARQPSPQPPDSSWLIALVPRHHTPQDHTDSGAST